MQLPKPLKILIVDDDIVDRKFIAKRLTANVGTHIELFEATNLQEAAEQIETKEFDCLLIDYLLPPTSSLGFIKEIRDKYPSKFMGIILLTGEGDEYLAVESLKSGAHDYLNKEHITSEAILRAVNTAISHAQLEKRSYIQQQALINFAGTVVHDLKTPLSGIFGYLQLAQMEQATDSSSRIQKHIDLALASANYMKNVIDGIYEYVAKGESEEAKLELDLNDIAQEAWRLVTGSEDTLASIVIENLPKFRGQTNEFVQLFQNLFANAIKHAGEAVAISVDAEEDETKITLSITDNGPGVPPALRSLIFVPLNKGASANAGTGLGLAICTKIIENHGGKIWCTAAPYGGARFLISLPREKNVS